MHVVDIYIDIVLDVPDTSGESKNNIGPPSGGPKKESAECTSLEVCSTLRQRYQYNIKYTYV